MKNLKHYREQIDKIDSQLLQLFEQRMEVSLDIAEYKKEHGLPIFDPKREQEKLDALNQPYEAKLYSTIFELSREHQEKQAKIVKINKKRILVINGPNLNMLGVREPEIYGSKTYDDLVKFVHSIGKEIGIETECVQSNHEGAIVDTIQEAFGNFDGIVINPAALTHTSVAIYDGLKTVSIPAVEVHLTDVYKRAEQEGEEFRKVSYVSRACIKTIAGLGFDGYAVALREILGVISE